LQYRWNDPSWSGVQAFSPQELNAALKLKQGDVADSMKIAKIGGDISGVYGKKGYLKIGLKPEPSFDDARRLVTYHIAVTEGSQYRMGQLTIAGLPEDDAVGVKSAWGLKTGEVFDTSYFRAFLEKVGRERLIKQPQGLKVGQELKRDDQRLIVDVVVKYQR
jgi:outer membrane protein assembly factor BamA